MLSIQGARITNKDGLGIRFRDQILVAFNFVRKPLLILRQIYLKRPRMSDEIIDRDESHINKIYDPVTWSNNLQQ